MFHVAIKRDSCIDNLRGLGDTASSKETGPTASSDHQVDENDNNRNLQTQGNNSDHRGTR